MSKTHDLKTWPEPFAAVWSGAKSCEIRKDDRGFDVGDALLLREYDPKTEAYSGRHVIADVTWLARGPDWGLPIGMCVMAISTYCGTNGSRP